MFYCFHALSVADGYTVCDAGKMRLHQHFKRKIEQVFSLGITQCVHSDVGERTIHQSHHFHWLAKLAITSACIQKPPPFFPKISQALQCFHPASRLLRPSTCIPFSRLTVSPRIWIHFSDELHVHTIHCFSKFISSAFYVTGISSSLFPACMRLSDESSSILEPLSIHHPCVSHTAK